jgi:ACS family tartrate transporter-like MFS transporter
MQAVADRAPLETALRKAEWRILPLLALGYLVAFMDRANISFAAGSMNQDLHFSPQVYGLGAGLFFVSYALCEIPSNRLLLRFGARRWLARILLTWGLLAVAMVLVRGRSSFYGMRLLLGAAEAGYFPGVLYFLSLWFPAAKRARAISLFYISLPLSSVVMGVVAGTLLRLDGRLGLHGWQWLFLVEGLPAIGLGMCVWFRLPESPATAKWLNAEERTELRAELSNERPALHEGTRNALLWTVMRQPRVWVLGAFAFSIYAPIYAVVFFLPGLLRTLTGLSAGNVGLLIALSGGLGAVAMVLVAMHSDRTRERRWHILVPCVLIAGLLLFAGSNLHGTAAAGALLVTAVAYMAMQGPLMTVITEVCCGEAAALAIATINMCGILGGFAGPSYMGWMRELTGSFAAAVGGLCVPWMVAVGCLVWATRRPAEETVAGGELIAAIEESL